MDVFQIAGTSNNRYMQYRASCKRRKKRLRLITSEFINYLRLYTNIIRATFVRLVLFCYTTYSVSQVVLRYNEEKFWCILLLLIPLLIEGFIRLKKHKGEESKWFCFCYLFFLLPNMSCIWLMELKAMRNITESNHSTDSNTHDSNTPGKPASYAMDHIHQEINKITDYVPIDQGMIALLIIMRAILPRGGLSYKELSELLLAYLAIAADTIDFFTPAKDLEKLEKPAKEKCDRSVLLYVILSAWSCSLIQFTLVLTASKSRIVRQGFKGNTFMSDERWSIIATTLLMDAPYFAVRVYMLSECGMSQNKGIIFFTIKNACLLLFQINRFLTLSFCPKQRSRSISEGLRDTSVSPISDEMEQKNTCTTTSSNQDDEVIQHL